MLLFVLRHADRDGAADALSAAGLKRAQLLAHMLSESGVGHAYCSDARRTHQTLEPLKQLLGDALTITEFSAEEPAGLNGHVQAVVAAARALPATAVAVAVSHSNTVGSIINRLEAGVINPIGDGEFDRLFVVVTPPNGDKTLVKLLY